MSLSFSFLLLMSSPTSGNAWVAPPSAERSSVGKVTVEVDHAALLEQQIEAAAEDSAHFVREDTVKALREMHGVEVVEDSDMPAILIGLAWEDYERAVYRIEVSTQRPGQAPQTVEEFTETCIDSTSLSQAVLARLPAALVQLRAKSAAEPAPMPEPAEEEGVEPPTEPASGPEDSSPSGRRPLGLMGKVGTGLSASGVVGLVAGGIVFAQGRRLDDAPTGLLDPQGRDFRPPGIGVMVTGGVLVATGAVLLIVDRVRARRGARELAHVSLRPDGTTTGLSLRF